MELDAQPRYRHVMEAVFGHPWAIRQEKLAAIAELVRMRVDGFRLDPQAIADIAAAGQRPPARASAGVTAVLPLYGTILWRVGMLEQMSGAASLQQFSHQFDAAMNDDRVKAIVIDVDSPGGQIDGVPETAAKIFNARGVKPVTSVINTLGCSAAYWLARAAETCLITPSGMAGSVGVYMLHEDDSAALAAEGVKMTFIEAPEGGHKSEGNTFEPLAAAAQASAQAMCNEIYGWFVADLARFTGQSEATIRGEQFGRGSVFLAADAVSRKMVDRVASLEDVLGSFASPAAATPAPSPPSPYGEGMEYDQRRSAALAQLQRIKSL